MDSAKEAKRSPRDRPGNQSEGDGTKFQNQWSFDFLIGLLLISGKEWLVVEVQEPDRYVKICGEKKSADSEVVASFCDDFAELIEKEKYELRDVYNSNETGLFYFQVEIYFFFFNEKGFPNMSTYCNTYCYAY